MKHGVKEQLLALVEEGFQAAAWHGPNLRRSLSAVSAQEASWRPGKDRHNIWEIMVHATYWKYAVTKRLTGSKKRAFPEKGKNWFARGAGLSKGEAERKWKRDLALLEKTHRELRVTIANLKEAEIEGRCRGSRQTVKQNVVGIAMHDVYHAGQIQMLRRLRGGRNG